MKSEQSMNHVYMPQARRRTIAFLAVLLGIGLFFAYVIGKPFLRPLTYGAILATVFYPLHQWLLSRVGNSHRAALLSTGVVFLLIVVPFTVLLDIAAVQAAAISKGVAERSASEGGFVPFLAQVLDRPLQFLGRYVDLSGFDVQDQLGTRMKEIGVKLLPTAATVVGNLAGFLAGTALAIITCYFFLREGDRLVSNAIRFLPLNEHHASQLLETLKNTIVANVQGVFAVGAAQGLATGLALVILGVSPATLLGILAAFCSVIPVVGAGLVWGPAAIYLIATGKIAKGLVLLALGGGVISMLDNVIRPLVVSNKMQANPLVLMLAMLGGVQTFGFLGLFVGPVVVAMVLAIGRMLSQEIVASSAADTITIT
jgi:predicted PurR-regulated permease PerM